MEETLSVGWTPSEARTPSVGQTPSDALVVGHWQALQLVQAREEQHCLQLLLAIHCSLLEAKVHWWKDQSSCFSLFQQLSDASPDAPTRSAIRHQVQQGHLHQTR